MSFSAILPADHKDAANAELEAAGWGPGNFSVPVFDAGVATHAALHCWDIPAFREAVEALPPEYGIQFRDAKEERPREKVSNLAAGLSITWPPQDEWLDNLPMKGDVRTFNGVEWRSRIDDNVWAPSAYPQGWERVEAQTGNQWKANTAYTVGQIVTYSGAQYECIQAHTSQLGWEPPNVPALWSPV